MGLVHLAPVPESVALARRLVATAPTELGREDLQDDAAIAVTELVANAVILARTEITVAVDVSGAGIRVSVVDAQTSSLDGRLFARPRPADAGS